MQVPVAIAGPNDHFVTPARPVLVAPLPPDVVAGKWIGEFGVDPGVAPVGRNFDRLDASDAGVGVTGHLEAAASHGVSLPELGYGVDRAGAVPAPVLPVTSGVLVANLDLGQPLHVDLAPVARNERANRRAVCPRQRSSVHPVGQ